MAACPFARPSAHLDRQPVAGIGYLAIPGPALAGFDEGMAAEGARNFD
jgi:hypothetical protein